MAKRSVNKIKEEFAKKTGTKWGDEIEFAKDQVYEGDFPKTKKRYFIIYDSFTASIEEAYYWVMNSFKYDLGMGDIEKITDLFSASEHSTFFGVAQQRVGIQQDKVSQFLGSIGKMIKDMFQIVRELRIIDERLELYYRSKKMNDFDYDNKKWEEERNPESESNHEISVKGLYVDMAEGGAKNPASVFGLAQQLQYTTLPDLFFSIHPANDREVTEMVDGLEFNKNVKWVLKRKLVSYLKWKKHTYKELLSRKKFQVRYLRQHWNTIRMYISWVKPYLKNIQRMRNDSSKNDSAELVSVFEGSLAEIEIVSKYFPVDNKHVMSCVSTHFEYRTSPQMNYTGEGYQRAPLHLGEIKITMRSYGWTQEELDQYRQIRQMEDLELALEVEQSLKDAMDALGGDVEKYLKEAEQEIEPPAKGDEEEPEKPGLLDPFKDIWDGFVEPFRSLKPKKKEKKEDPDLGPERSKAIGENKMKMWLTYKNFKKAHRMIQW